MNRLLKSLALTLLIPTAAVADSIRLGNEPWPPFVLEGEERGTAEAIVCEALARGGHDCALVHDSWEATLAAAEAGRLDGIAAAWFTPERGRVLLYSAAYLTNRLVPVTRVGGPEIRDVQDLDGRDVALEVAVAYGDALLAARERFTSVDVRGSDEALAALRDGRAEVAVVDELFARDALDDGAAEGLVIGDVALAFRELHFAMSRAHPQAQGIVADFNRAYREMLRDGTVNRILDLEWLATDLESDGVMEFIHRGGGLDAAVAEAAAGGTVYALGQDDYQAIRDPGFTGSNANYLSDDESYQTPEAAMQALEPGRRCAFDSSTARVVCTRR